MEQVQPTLAAIDRLDQLTAGDLTNVLRQLRVTWETANAELINRLLATEAPMKLETRVQRLGFAA